MKKLFQSLCIVLFTCFLTVGLLPTSLPADAQLSVFHRVHSPSAGELPVLKAAQLKHSASAIKLTSYDSSGDNWSGYTAGSSSGNGFIGVEGTWNAPCSTGTRDSSHQYGSWVGLGGYFGTESLEQAGVILQTDGTYRLFWEYAPYNSPYIDKTDVIHCGDHLLAWVHFGISYCSNGGFYAHVEDDSTGAHLGSTCLTESHGIGIKSADWIDERPLLTCGAPSYLADFQYTQWSNVLAQANASGATFKNPNNFPNTQVLMHDFTTGEYIAEPDGLQVSSSNTFTDRWYRYGTLCD